MGAWSSFLIIVPGGKMEQYALIKRRHFKTSSLFKNIFLDFWKVLYSTLLPLPLLRFHCVGGYWDRTQDCCDFNIGSQSYCTH
jgi:hypothetical protein